MTVSPLPGPKGARRRVASVETYQDAERAVDWLSDQGFAVDRVSIVGTGLRYVEQVSGRLTTGRAALVGLGQGAWIGFFFGLLFSLFFDLSTGGFFGLLLYGIVTCGEIEARAAPFGLPWIGRGGGFRTGV
jgi:heat induced stress protein YflT